jgi:hypothetical protein
MGQTSQYSCSMPEVVVIVLVDYCQLAIWQSHLWVKLLNSLVQFLKL